MAVNTVSQRQVKDRRLYIWVAVLFPLIVLVVFARTYYLKPLFNTPAIRGFLVHLHGAVMTAWVVLFVTQVRLVASRRTRVHQRLGVWGSVLAALVLIVGVATALAAAARGSSVPGIPPLSFLIVPLGDMILFGTLVGAALYYRRRMEIHKRLMLLAALSLLTPAIARIPLSFIENGGALAFFGITDLFIVGSVTIDTLKDRKLHPAFLWDRCLSSLLTRYESGWPALIFG